MIISWKSESDTIARGGGGDPLPGAKGEENRGEFLSPAETYEQPKLLFNIYNIKTGKQQLNLIEVRFRSLKFKRRKGGVAEERNRKEGSTFHGR